MKLAMSNLLGRFALPPPMHFVLHRIKKRAQILISWAADGALVLGLILLVGIGSSWYMIEWGSSLTTLKFGPWETWSSEARADADPYTRAHVIRAGTLNLSGEVAATYVAGTDSEGVRLHSSCDYEIKGLDLDASWWSISVFNDSGGLIENAANRYSFTSDTVTLAADGTFLVSLARDARHGNWLPTGGGGRLQLILTLLEGRAIGIDGDEAQLDPNLPSIDRVNCR